jgi:hypothetical protein
LGPSRKSLADSNASLTAGNETPAGSSRKTTPAVAYPDPKAEKKPALKEEDFVIAYLDVLGTRFKDRREDTVSHAQKLVELKEFAQTVGQLPGLETGGVFGPFVVAMELGLSIIFQAPGLIQRRADHFSDSIYLTPV